MIERSVEPTGVGDASALKEQKVEADLLGCLQSWQGSVTCRISILRVLCELMEVGREDELMFAQRLIAEQRPAIYFMIARVFVETRLLAFRMKTIDTTQPEDIWELPAWFLDQTAYVMQFLFDLDRSNGKPSAVEEALRDVRTILSLFSNAFGEKHKGSIQMIHYIRDALASTDLPPDAVFNIEDKLHAIEFKRPRLCAFGNWKSALRFESIPAIRSLLCSREDMITQHLTTLTDEKLERAIQQLSVSDRTIRVNWVPYAEQIPFSLFFGLLCHEAERRGKI